MNEAPKKIWLLPGLAKKLAWDRTRGAQTPYIRADLVDDLVEAVEKIMEFNESYWKLINFSPASNGAIRELTNKVEAALAKARGESND